MSEKFTKPVMTIFRVAFFTALASVCCAGTLFADNDDSVSKKESEGIIVRGIVRSDDNSPLPGVNIHVKGSVEGTVTDADGKYSIEVPSPESVLIFSFIGFLTEEITVGTKTVLDVTLIPDISTLQEVVVIGYGKQERKDVTGAIGTVSATEITKSAATSIEQALQGRVAGVQMTTNTGLPGGGTSIQIRGLNSINSTNEPIYVIDGVIISSGTGSYTNNAFAAIAPSDIESIDVLKDASAAAIYGAQGANGVIIITTKRGKEGKPRVTIDAQVSQQQIPHYLEMVNLREYAQHQNDLYTLKGQPVNAIFADPSVLSDGTNWQKEIFKPAKMQNYNFSVSGGNAGTTYKFAGNYLDQDGIAAGSGFKRFYVSTAVDSKISSWLKGGVSLTATNTSQRITITDYNLINTALRQSPAIPARSLGGESFGGPEAQFDNNPSIASLLNPLALAELIDRGSEKTGARGNLYFEVAPVKWLTVKSEVATDINIDQSRLFIPTYKLGDAFNSQLTNQKSMGYGRFTVWRNLATASHKFDRHDVSLMLGYEMNQNKGAYLMGQRLGGSNELPDLSSGNTDAASVSNAGTTYRRAFISYFGRLTYAYDDKYLLTATVRKDGSSNFAPGYQWGKPFPSASIGWRLSSEPFFQAIPHVNEVKFRFGYGESGNSNTRPFVHTALLSNVPTIWGTGHLTANVPNPTVTWETTKSFNIGLDLGIFQDRVQLVADVYQKTTSDLLLQVLASVVSGAAGGVGSALPPYANVGSMENKGIELSLKTVNLDKGGFTWSTNLTYTLNRNKVLGLNTESGYINSTYQLNGATYIVSRTEVGRSVGEFYGYKIAGRINSRDDLYDSDGNLKVALPESTVVNRNTGIWVGDFLWEDHNKDSVINEKDLQYLGSPLPKFTYGIGNTFTYKNFDLNVFLSGVYGNKVMNFLGLSIDNTNNNGIRRRAATQYAKLDLIDPAGPSGPTATDIGNVYVSSGAADLPRISVSDVNGNNSRLSSRFIEDGSYLRIQNVSLGYNAPKSLASKIGLQSVRVVISAKNLYTFTKYSGYDAEVGMLKDQYSNSSQNALLNGIDVGRYPSPRIYSFSLSLGF